MVEGVERGACIPSHASSAFGCEQSRSQASRKSERRAHGVRHTWLLARGEPQIDRSGRKTAQQSCTGVTRTGCQSRRPHRTPPPDHLMAPKPTRCRVCSRQSASCRSGRHDKGCSKQCVRRGEGDHGRRESARRLPGPPWAQGKHRQFKTDVDPRWHAGRRAANKLTTILRWPVGTLRTQGPA